MVDRRKVQVNLSFKQRERRFAAALAFAKRGDQGYTF